MTKKTTTVSPRKKEQVKAKKPKQEESFIDTAQEVGEKIYEKAEDLIKDNINEKLEEFATNKFLSWAENLSWIKELLNSPCLAELIKKLGKNIPLALKIIGGSSIVLGTIGIGSLFGHWHVLLEVSSFAIIGAISIVQGVGLLLIKKGSSSVILVNFFVGAILTLIFLLSYQQFIFGSWGNTLWFFVALFLVFIFVLKNRKMFK